MDRRAFLTAGALAAATVTATQLRSPATASATISPRTELYRSIVPEIFAPLPDPPEHTPAIVIGSGFGGAIAAYRLGEAGVDVTVLERGSKWPNDPWREIFCHEGAPDGRGIWHRDSFSDLFMNIAGVPMPLGVDDFGGVMCVDSYPNMTIFRAAAVGGGSIVYTGISLQPEKRHFDTLFDGLVDYAEMDAIYYPRVKDLLRVGPMPADMYNSPAFAHARAWDARVRRAGFDSVPMDSVWDWNIMRDEQHGRSRPSGTIGYSNLGNSNGSKTSLNQTYLRYARDTGNATVYPGHQVDWIGQEPNGRFTVAVTKLAPTGEVLRTRTLTCDRLYLGAGSVGTSELLVRARAQGTLPNLNEHVGEGWGTNGDVVMAPWALDTPNIGTNGAALASRVLDESGLPLYLENFAVPGVPLDVGSLTVIALVQDPTRGKFVHDAQTDRVVLDWPENGGDLAIAAAGAVSEKVARAGLMILPQNWGYAKACSHPLGGAVLGKATDGYGRVHGHPGLYVLDGAALPGNAAANPSLTISALAERNIAHILESGG